MGQVNLSDYKNLYLQTAKEYIDKMFLNLDLLSKNVLDKDALNNLHISSHSLKSQSQVMGFVDVANICLNIEKISDDASKGVAQLSNEDALSIKKEVGRLSEMLKQAKYSEEYSA